MDTGGGGGDDSNSTRSSKNNKLYKGVRLRKWGKWVSEIRLPNSRERIWLGSYDSAEKAARAFDAALYCLRGRHASFNFPNTPFDLDINVAAAGRRQSLTPQQIQQIAQTFANKKDNVVLPSQEQHQQQQQQPESLSATSSCTQGSMNNIDWTFLNVLDHDQSNNAAAAVGSSSSDHFGLFSNLEKMHSDDFTYSTPFYEEQQIEGDIDDIHIDDDHDPFSHQTFLWSWNF